MGERDLIRETWTNTNDPPCQGQLAQPNAFERPQGLYSLSVTLNMFLTQCLSDDHTCRTAVATAKDRGWLPPHASPDTGAYCLCP